MFQLSGQLVLHTLRLGDEQADDKQADSLLLQLMSILT